MKKGAKAILIILALAAVALVAYLIYRRFHKNDEEGGTTSASNGSGSGSASGTSTTGNDNFPLKKGSRGEKVKFVQQYINWVNGKTALSTDGIWGANTELWARKTFLVNQNDTRSLEIDVEDYNAMVRIWNFSHNNNLTYAQFSANYHYNYQTGKVEKVSGSSSSSVLDRWGSIV